MKQGVVTGLVGITQIADAELKKLENVHSLHSIVASRILERHNKGTYFTSLENPDLPELNSIKRTPILAVYGYQIEHVSQEVQNTWIQTYQHLMGRDIFPADRQSFVFNPLELFGITYGVISNPASSSSEINWLSNSLQQGITDGQFSTNFQLAIAEMALHSLLIDDAQKNHAQQLVPKQCETSELFTLMGLYYWDPRFFPIDHVSFETELNKRTLTETLKLTDKFDAAVIKVCSERFVNVLTNQQIRKESACELIVNLCRRFPLFAHELENRQRKRDPITIHDEYDVQDLLQGILMLHFDDVRPEDVTPSYAGNYSRVDFYLPSERIMIEAKMTRKNLGQKDVVDQLILDVARYEKRKDVDTLICFVYDPARKCKTPSAVENDVSEKSSRLKVSVVVCPRGT